MFFHLTLIIDRDVRKKNKTLENEIGAKYRKCVNGKLTMRKDIFTNGLK